MAPWIFSAASLLISISIIPVHATPYYPTSNTTNTTTSPSQRAQAAINSLMTFYDQPSGLWNLTDSAAPWWASGNALQAVLDYMLTTGSREYVAAAENTVNIQRAPLAWWPSGGGDFRADSTDDTGWWALAMVRMYEVTQDETYLTIAKEDEAYMYSFWNTSTCGGGIIWDIPSRSYHNAISNELYLELTASLHNVIPGDTLYLDRALQEWAWFKNSGMINNQSLVNDGLTEDAACTNNGDTTWTYNQGVILGGLTQLYLATGNSSLLMTARSIADAVIASPLLSPGGILTEPCDSEATCEPNGAAFKGIFVRNLVKLDNALPGSPYSGYLATQAQSMYANDRNATDFYGFSWAGPFDDGSTTRQTSAVCLLTAVL